MYDQEKVWCVCDYADSAFNWYVAPLRITKRIKYIVTATSPG